MKPILPAIDSFIKALPVKPKRLFAGVSGGLDSAVLLHLLARWQIQHKEIPLVVLHVNHHLQEAADSFENFVKKLAENYALHCEIMNLSAGHYQHKNIEAAAREGRYDFFASQLEAPTDYLFLAHHRQDQVETFFLNLQRGAGLAGLAAMPSLRRLGRGMLARPLLAYSRAELAQYRDEHELSWVEDASNEDTSLNRNFLRKEILPRLNARWPHFDTHAEQAISKLQEAREVMESYLCADLEKITAVNALNLKALKVLPAARHLPLIQHWIKCETGKILSHIQLTVIMNEVVHAAPDCRPLFEVPGVKITRQKGFLRLV